MFKKYISFGLALLLIMSISLTSFAANSKNQRSDYDEYIKFVERGILAEDITFEYWKQLMETSYALEEILEASGEFILVYDSTGRATFPPYSLTKGDVFITNGTSSAGILGHAGIAISSDEILHIAGPGQHPDTITLSGWNAAYTPAGWTKVYRHSNANVAKKAAQWASDTYEGTSVEYVISMDLSSTNETYCSKLVWQAYYYGPDEACADGPTWGVRLPYDLPTSIHNLNLEKTYGQT